MLNDELVTPRADKETFFTQKGLASEKVANAFHTFEITELRFADPSSQELVNQLSEKLKASQEKSISSGGTSVEAHVGLDEEVEDVDMDELGTSMIEQGALLTEAEEKNNPGVKVDTAKIVKETASKVSAKAGPGGKFKLMTRAKPVRKTA